MQPKAQPKAQPKVVLWRSQESNLRPWFTSCCLWPCSLAVPVLAGWDYGFCCSMSTNTRRLDLLKCLRRRVKKLFVAFPWVETSTGPGGLMICVFYYMMGTPEGSTESGFMEKPGIEPATPGLQGIALIHYTTGASLNFLWLFQG